MVDDPLKDYPGYSLRRASSTIMAELARRLAELNLRPTDASVLLIIDANPNITQSEIGRMLEMASANTATLMSRLAERELIEREPVDGRSHGLSLTTTGRALLRRAKRLINTYEEGLLAKVSTTHREIFLQVLHTLWASDEE